MSLEETERKYTRERKIKLEFGAKKGLESPHGGRGSFRCVFFGGAELGAEERNLDKEQEDKKEKRKKLLKKAAIILGAVVLLVGIVWLTLQIRKSAFTDQQVKISISGPEKVKSGESVSFDIDYQNLNRASLNGAVLYITIPKFQTFGQFAI